MTIIRDPVSGYGMAVDSEGRGQVEAKVLEAACEANSHHKTAYVMNLPAVILGSNWIWAVIKNSDDLDLTISRCVLWTATSKANDFVGAYTRGSFSYLANGTAAVPACCNSGGALSADGLFYYNDAVGSITTVTAGQQCGSLLLTSTPQEFKISSHWIVPKNQVFYLQSELANDNTYRGWIEFYFHANG